MGTVSEKLTYLNTTKEKLKDSINIAGGNLTAVDTFRSYAKKLNKSFIDIINNGTANLYNNFPKVTKSGSNLDLSTERGKLKLNLLPNLEQYVLPSGYTQVDYIASDGNQYIDTGISGDTLSGTIVAEYSTIGSSNGVLLGKDGYRWFGQRNSTGNYGVSTTDIGVSSLLKKEITFDFNGQTTSIELDGNTYSSTASNENKNYTYTFFAGRFYNSGNISYYSSVKIYSLILKDGDTLLRNYIPCYRNSDNEVGMYDLVNNVFYTNQGTGAFTYGSAINIPNPDYPQDIKVVTGSNDLKIINKNLLNVLSNTRRGYIDSSGNFVENIHNIISDYIYVSHNKYTLSYKEEVNLLIISEYDINKNFIIRQYTSTQQSNTFTLNANTKYVVVGFNNGDTQVHTPEYWLSFEPQLEEGNLATNYLAYGEQKYPITLSSKNLANYLDISNAPQWIGYQESKYIEINGLKPNTKYTMSSNVPYNSEGQLYFNGATGSNRVYLNNNCTQTADENGRLFFGAFSNRAYYNDIINGTYYIQIEEGESASSYEPYYNIEYCKIGNYADQIYPSTGKNLFDLKNENFIKRINTTTLSILNDGFTINKTDALLQERVTVYKQLKPNTTYTISTTPTEETGKYLGAYLAPVDEISTSAYPSGNAGLSNVATTNSYGILAIIFYFSTALVGDYTVKNIQLEEGSTVTRYEPYGLNEWCLMQNVGKISSYNGETITTPYISTTGGLDIGATVYYGLETPTYIHISQEDYPTLKGQLDNIYNNAKSYEDKTYITVESEEDNAQLEVEASALKNVDLIESGD